MQKYNKKKSSLSILSIAGLKPYKKSKNESYMNQTQLLHFKNILEAWLKQLKNESKNTNSCIKIETSNFPDLIDRAVQEEEFSLNLKNRDRERRLIKKIKITLKKVENKSFGFCESCGIEIGIRRLEARPTADLCIDCKTLAEIKEKQILST